MKSTKTAFIICVLFALSCSQDPAVKQDIMALASLSELEGCDEVLDSLKQSVIAEMEERVDANMESVLSGDYCDRYEYPYDDYGVMDACADAGSYPPPESTPPPEENGEEASEYSETNTQVVGVDEADFIKNDGGYIYILADGRFKIIDAWPAEESRLIASFPVEGDPRSMFVHNDKVVVYSAPGYGSEADDPYYRGGECTYGYDCDFTGDGKPLKITVLDITDRTEPLLVRETWFSGSYINSRRIEDAVYTVISFPEIMFPDLAYWPEGTRSYCPDSGLTDKWVVKAAFEKLKAENREKIEGTEVTDWLPGVTDKVYTDSGSVTTADLLAGCENFFESDIKDGNSLLTIAAFDMMGLDPMNMSTIIGRPGAVYASHQALYVASRHSSEHGGGWYYDELDTVREVTTIHKFVLDYEAADAAYAVTGVAKGRILNQFSMDEHEGYLRIATTTGHLPGPDVHSTLSVLEQKNGRLDVVGQVDNIAPTEDIRSVRFNGNKGFMVTFKKTDPLFVLELSDPENPKIAGELKIPGFSTYMHIMDDNHVLSIGYDADDQGSFAWFTGIQLQIFDVSKLDDPTLIHKEVIGTRGSTSDATTNHMAFNFFAPRDLLAIPMTICEGGSGGGMSGDTMTFSGLMVFRVTVDEGFSELGRVSHADPDAVAQDPYFSCGNWWTNSNSLVKRSVFMEDYVYSVARELIKVNHIDTLGDDLAAIDLVD
ncbi:MAG: beta-propeller domain-containing protein [Pseudomonadota bacterium]